MAFEPERKYLVNLEKFLAYLNSELIHGEEKLIGTQDIMQAYLNNMGDWVATVTVNCDLILSSVSSEMKVTYHLSSFDTRQLLEYPTTKMIGSDRGIIDRKSWVSRIRIYDETTAEVCLKEKIAGDKRGECEANSDIRTANDLFDSVEDKVAKLRHFIMKEGYKWEVDLFRGENTGLCIAELETEDKNYPWLSFIEKEITDDIRYYNDELSRKPYSQW